MPRSLPACPDLANLRKQARSILRGHRRADSSVVDVLRLLPRFGEASDEKILSSRIPLQHVQQALARSYGFLSWTDLRDRVGLWQLVHRCSGPADPRIAAFSMSDIRQAEVHARRTEEMIRVLRREAALPWFARHTLEGCEGALVALEQVTAPTVREFWFRDEDRITFIVTDAGVTRILCSAVETAPRQDGDDPNESEEPDSLPVWYASVILLQAAAERLDAMELVVTEGRLDVHVASRTPVPVEHFVEACGERDVRAEHPPPVPVADLLERFRTMAGIPSDGLGQGEIVLLAGRAEIHADVSFVSPARVSMALNYVV